MKTITKQLTDTYVVTLSVTIMLPFWPCSKENIFTFNISCHLGCWKAKSISLLLNLSMVLMNLNAEYFFDTSFKTFNLTFYYFLELLLFTRCYSKEHYPGHLIKGVCYAIHYCDIAHRLISLIAIKLIYINVLGRFWVYRKTLEQVECYIK